MRYSITQLMLLFYSYAFLGWCLEVVFTVCNRKKFVNKGFLNGPMCPLYGFSAIFVTVVFREIFDNVVFLFLGSMVIITFLELITGKLLYSIFHQKWWDYSDQKLNFDGYICAKFSLFWGAFGVLGALVVNPFILGIIKMLPVMLARIANISLTAMCLCDCIGTAIVLLHIRKRKGRLEVITGNLEKVSGRLRNWINTKLQNRMEKAFPKLDVEGKKIEKQKSTVFAEGCGFYKLVSLFFIGAFLGDIIETIFMYITTGKLVNRSSVIFGQFSIVWGLAVVIMTFVLYNYRKNRIWVIFLVGTLLGGTYEYTCSVFTEIVFGTIFWDYSDIPFNLAGRINLLYCFFWGAVAVIWVKLLYPPLSRLIEKVPMLLGKILCIVLLVFIIADGIFSGGALLRYQERNDPQAYANMAEYFPAAASFYDTEYPDEVMKKIYPYAKIASVTKERHKQEQSQQKDDKQ